jgi:electron transport complex protein RnfB
MKKDLLIAEIDAILPQTQCRQCGFDGCEPYAAAIAEGRAPINQCPPGGEQGIRHLAQLLGVSPLPLNTAHGVTKPKAVAFIEESACIGCTLCIAACPVDAIVGAAKLAHTVISGECTGCELCVPPCPVNCISMVPINNAISYSGDTHAPDVAPQQSPTATLSFSRQQDERMKASERARARYRSRLRRLAREKVGLEEKLAMTTSAPKSGNTPFPDPAAAIAGIKRAAIKAALAHAKAYRPPAGEKNQS